MQRVQLKKRNIISIAVIVVLAVVAALVCALSPRAASAEGNDAGSSTIKTHMTINLNLNGRDSRYDTSVLDSNINVFGTNNDLNLRVRTINRNAIVDSYVANETSVTGINSSDYKIFAVQNTSTAVSVTPTNGDEREGYSDIIVTALKVTTARGGRFSVLLKNVSTGAEITAYCSANVSNTFVHLGSTGGAWTSIAGNDKKILVGGVLNASYVEDDSVTHVDGKHTEIMQVYNNTQLTISLDKYLQNRALYCKANGNDVDYSTPIVMGTTDKKWGISSVSNFRITSVSFADMANAFSTAVCSDPTSSTRIPPSATVDVKITSSAITSCNKYTGLPESEKIKKFWSETHNVSVTFQEITGNTSYTIIIPTVFYPNKPLNKQISAELLRLDVTAPYTRDLKTLKFTKNSDGSDAADTEVTGYNSVIIRADDLIEYSYPGNGDGESDPDNWGRSLCFSFTDDDKQAWLTSNDYSIEIPEGEDAYRPFKIRITAKSNGNFTLNFNVQYFTAKGDDNIAIKPASVSITGYGSYTVVIDSIAGKKKVTYNIFSANSPFYELLNDGYQLTDIQSNTEYLDAKLHSDNTVTLTPMVDKIDGQAVTTVWMEFTNSDGRTIYLTSREFNIDINAGSFWRQFEDWQAILIIIGICIGGIAIILFIVWMFIRAISKRRQEENSTMAPVSSYIIKLNSTIAATQAQQRMAASQAISQASGQMLLGAGATSTVAPDPNMLALGAGAGDTTPPPTMSTPGSAPAMSTPGSEPGEDIEALIAKYITDEELLERIFTEKYEPKGMVRRTFFKSKELQARELEKEKKRIIERYNSPMPMDEAIMSESEVQKAEAMSTPSAPRMSEPAPQAEAFILNFDPDSPLYTPEQEPAPDEFAAERIEDLSPEESNFKDLEKRYAIVLKELEELGRRLDNVQSELDKNTGAADELRERIANAEAADEQFGKDIEELEFSLASAKQKDKDRIKRDIGIKEEKKARNLDELAALRAELETLLNGGDSLSGIKSKLDDTKVQKDGEEQDLSKQLEKARAEFEAYQIRLAKVKARQELDAKVEVLSPLLVDVNTTDFELKQLESAMAQLEKERDALKSDVAAAKSQILGANDFDIINDLNTRISDANARLSEIEKEVTKSTKRKSELTIEFNAQRRKANDYVEKNEIPLEEVITAEDLVIGNIELDHLKGEREIDRAAAEQRVAEAHALYDDLSASSADVTMVAMDIAAGLKDIEDAIAEAQAELDAINAQMETAGDDEKLMLMVDQGDKSDKIEELKEKLKQANVEGTKRKMEAQSEYDGKLEEAKTALDEANEEFKSACARYDALVDNTNPIDLITSGSGVISQDQKKIEAENYKKQLEKQKAEAEQARLAAQMAEEAAEKARQDAAREAEDAKAEAERKAQEAIAEAEAARLEAEEKARLEAESAENARREAEEMAENARREAEEAAENARREAEEAAENARREAEEAAENARREAEEAAENARREAEESAENARREAEEAALAEAEEAKRKAQEELDEMRRRAEEEAERVRREETERQLAEAERERVEAERREAIAKKVAARKERIINFRDRMKDVKGEEDAKNLREQLYTFQLSFDEDERGSSELMDFYNKTMDDIQHAGEIATLKAENAKKPKRVVKKVTERVNRIPKKKAGARRPGARRPGARPSGSRAGARPAARGARPAGASRPAARPSSGARPTGARRPAPRPPAKR